MKNNLKKRKFVMPIVTAALVTVLGVGSLGYVARAATTDKTNGTTTLAAKGTRNGFGAGRGEGATGVVSAVNGTNITLTGKNGKSYVVDVSSATLLKSAPYVKGQKPGAPTPITLSDVKVGDTIMVNGTMTGLNIKAVKMVDEGVKSNTVKKEKSTPKAEKQTKKETKKELKKTSQKTTTSHTNGATTTANQ